MAQKTRAKAEGNQPISRHPLFPAIVALWFGALFGLVSLAIKPELIEQIVIASGIDSVVPMAAPPLGTTTRILLALAMTGIGGITGALIAVRIARPEPTAQERGPRRAPRGGSNGLALTARRAAAETQPDIATRKPFPEAAILNVSEFDLEGDDGAVPTFTPVAVARDVEPSVGGHHLFETYSREIVAHPAGDVETPEPDCEPLEREQQIAADIPAPPATRAAERIASAELDTLSQVELLERLALAMARCRKPVVPAAAATRLEIPGACATAPATADDPEPGIEPTPEADTSFPAAAAWAEQEEPHPEIALSQEETEAGASMPESEPKPLRMPAALRPVGHDSPDNDDALPGYVPPRHIALPPEHAADFAQPQPFAFAEEEETEEDVMEEGYSSLLDLSRSSAARLRYAGEEEWAAEAADLSEETDAPDEGEGPPTKSQRPFDGPRQSDPDETEKALRAALATLQRMSGAA